MLKLVFKKIFCVFLDDGGNKLWKTTFGLHTQRAWGKETGGCKWNENYTQITFLIKFKWAHLPSLVFRMVEAEEEYVEQLEILISCFLRPFKMAASSKNPPCSHEDINSIFLNSETVLFLHQIFLKGLTARMDSWPTLVLGTSLGAISFRKTVF